ncbi:MAG: ABC transporter permease [Gammaproteobacteria bacterium]|nr:ABC transporter permease [Gammaproteobacteria bacterium]
MSSSFNQTTDSGNGVLHYLSVARKMSTDFWVNSPIGYISGVFLIIFLLIGIFADVISPYGPLEAHYDAMKQPPSGEYWLGTDHMGRDLLSRVMHGTRVTMIVAFVAIFIADTIGLAWGIISGYLGGKFDLFSQRLIDILMSFPSIILALLLLVVMGAGLETVIIAIAVTRIPGSQRVIRAVVLSVKETAYVEAARAIGASPLRVMARHVSPQTYAPLIVVATTSLGGAIFTEASLSFLGLGIPPPSPSWGNLLGGLLLESLRPPWWLMIAPGVCITGTILAFNLLGDGLRDHFDPRLRGKL